MNNNFITSCSPEGNPGKKVAILIAIAILAKVLKK